MSAPESTFWICLGKCAHWLLEIQDSRNRLSEWGDHEHGYTEIQESEYTENRETDRSGSAVREEFRLPGDLAETLREYAHQQRLKKTAVVIEALQEFFRHRHFPLPKR